MILRIKAVSLAFLIRYQVSYCFVCILNLIPAGRGYDLTFVEAEDSNVDIFEYGTNIYDNIIVFAPTAESTLSYLKFPDLTSRSFCECRLPRSYPIRR